MVVCVLSYFTYLIGSKKQNLVVCWLLYRSEQNMAHLLHGLGPMKSLGISLKAPSSFAPDMISNQQ